MLLTKNNSLAYKICVDLENTSLALQKFKTQELFNGWYLNPLKYFHIQLLGKLKVTYLFQKTLSCFKILSDECIARLQGVTYSQHGT